MAVSIEKISKTFPDAKVHVLQKFDFTMERQEVVGIVGPSGCGKSTLLRIIAGLEGIEQDGGTVSTLNGVPSLSFRSGRVALLSSQSALLPWRSSVDNVRLPLDLREKRTTATDAKAADMVEKVGITNLCDRYPHGLSDGQRQRVRLAQALVTEPELLLLDEPFNAVDIGLRARLIEIVSEYLSEKEGRGAIIVAHTLDEIIRLADKVYVLSGNPLGIESGAETTGAPLRIETMIPIEISRQEREKPEHVESMKHIEGQITEALQRVAN